MPTYIHFDGLEELEKVLKKNVKLDDVKKVVKHNGSQLQQKIQGNANFTRGYSTGQTKRSVDLKITDGGFTADSGPTTEYSPYVEYGTRKMSAQPFIKPGFESQKSKFISDLQKLVK